MFPFKTISATYAQGQHWSPLWAAFQSQHPPWAGIISAAAQPAYTVPTVIVDSLVRTEILTSDEGQAEHDFLGMCQKYSSTTVGVWTSWPVDYSLLIEVPTNFGVTQEQIDQLKWGDVVPPVALNDQLKELQKKTTAARHQMLGYAGKITFDNQYQQHLAELQVKWCGFPKFPLQASTGDGPELPQELEKHDDASAAFIKDATTFMRRWQLCSLVTWDLPYPQGPLENVPLVAARTVLGPDHPVTAFPSYYDVPFQADLRGDLRNQQRQAAKDAQIQMPHPATDIAARGDEASKFENAYRMWLIETTLRRRYPKRHGMVTPLISGFCDLFGFQEDRARQIRKVYTSFLV